VKGFLNECKINNDLLDKMLTVLEFDSEEERDHKRSLCDLRIRNPMAATSRAWLNRPSINPTRSKAGRVNR
jgi:hypothetical protein